MSCVWCRGMNLGPTHDCSNFEGLGEGVIWIIAGGRDFNDYELLSQQLDAQLDKPDMIVHGGAPGADALASRYAYERRIDLDIYGAKWGTLGREAGPARNIIMLDMYPQATVLAFPTESSRGTWHTVNQAKARGMEVYVSVTPI